jgi:hypothetical protein
MDWNWNYGTNPNVSGKYLVAVRQGTHIDYIIGWWSNDLSKIDRALFSTGECGWYNFTSYGIKKYNVFAWAIIPDVDISHAEPNDFDSEDDIFFD